MLIVPPASSLEPRPLYLAPTVVLIDATSFWIFSKIHYSTKV